MIGGGIYFATSGDGERAEINNCIIQAIRRIDTLINPLTFSSRAGFLFTLHRDGGLVDETGHHFLRSDSVTVSGDPKLRQGAGGAVISTLVIKIVLMQKKGEGEGDGVLDDLVLVDTTAPGYNPADPDNKTEKSSLSSEDIIIEQANHIALYKAFHSGEKLVPSLVGDLIELTTEKQIDSILREIRAKAYTDLTKRNEVIRVFEYFKEQIPKHRVSVVMMCMEMVGEDTKREDVNTYEVTSSNGNPNVLLAAARGAGAIQLLCLRKAGKGLIDAHQGNWFIDIFNLTNVRAIDFGRVVDIGERDMIIHVIGKYLRARQSASISVDSFLSTYKLSTRDPGAISALYEMFKKILTDDSVLPFFIDLPSRHQAVPQVEPGRFTSMDPDSRHRVHQNIHFCLVFAALFDNAITYTTYGDKWDQAQMLWAYQRIWGLDIKPDKHKNFPIYHILDLEFDYDAFITKLTPNQRTHVEESYDEIARLIAHYTALPLGFVPTGRRPTESVAGITATAAGATVPFTTRPSRFFQCEVMGGGSKRSRRYNKSKTRRGRRSNKSKTRRGRRYHRRAHQ